MRIKIGDRPSRWFTEFRVEVYHHDLPGPGEYVELEQLSALRRLDQGITLVTRWNVGAYA